MFCFEVKKSEDLELTAVCGLYCKLCEYYTIDDDRKILAQTEIKDENGQKFTCMGCRQSKGKCAPEDSVCDTYKCAAKRNVTFCFECEEFPCFKLAPAANEQGCPMHNLKIFNLCYIQNQGIEKFTQNAEDIINKYKQGAAGAKKRQKINN